MEPTSINADLEIRLISAVDFLQDMLPTSALVQYDPLAHLALIGKQFGDFLRNHVMLVTNYQKSHIQDLDKQTPKEEQAIHLGQ